MSIDTITISRENCSRLFAYSSYVPITRVNLDHHEISRGGKLYHSWRSSQVHNHKSSVDNHLMQHSLSAILRSHSSTSSSLGNVSPIFVVVREIVCEERKEIRTKSRWKKMKINSKSAQGRGTPPYSRDCSRAYEMGAARRAHLIPKHHCTRPMIRRVKRRVGLFDALHAPRVRVRWSCWACVLAETNSSARCLQPSQSSLRPRTFPPRRKNCPPRSRGGSASHHQPAAALHHKS